MSSGPNIGIIVHEVRGGRINTGKQCTSNCTEWMGVRVSLSGFVCMCICGIIDIVTLEPPGIVLFVCIAEILRKRREMHTNSGSALR